MQTFRATPPELDCEYQTTSVHDCIWWEPSNLMEYTFVNELELGPIGEAVTLPPRS